MWSTCPTRQREGYQGVKRKPQALLTLSPLVLNWIEDRTHQVKVQFLNSTHMPKKPLSCRTPYRCQNNVPKEAPSTALASHHLRTSQMDLAKPELNQFVFKELRPEMKYILFCPILLPFTITLALRSVLHGTITVPLSPWLLWRRLWLKGAYFTSLLDRQANKQTESSNASCCLFLKLWGQRLRLLSALWFSLHMISLFSCPLLASWRC